MSAQTNMLSALRRTDTFTTICVARQGRLCRCGTCTSSFVSTATTVSDVSTTCPPSEIDDRSQDFETSSRARCPPLQAFPTDTTLVESVYEYEDESLVGEFAGPNNDRISSSQNPFNLPLGRTLTLQSLARTDSVSSVASDRTVCAPKTNALQRNESAITNTTVDDYEYEEPATYLPPMQAPTRAIRAQCLAPTRSNYNLTPTAAVPLGRPANRTRWEGGKVSSRF